MVVLAVAVVVVVAREWAVVVVVELAVVLGVVVVVEVAVVGGVPFGCPVPQKCPSN